MMRIAVILTTYNRPDALAAALEGYRCQSDTDFELIVADDGSTLETREVIDSFRSRAPFPVAHVWQEDQGFRVAAIRNRALAATTAPYVIFSDGDCIPSLHFVSRHRALSEPGFFLAGNRILLSENFTLEVINNRIPVHLWRVRQWLAARLSKKINRLLPLIFLPGGWRKNAATKWEGAIGCNLSAWRQDLLAVNGFDESYSGWGLEDSDLVIRLIRSGIRRKSAKYAAPVFHLWHQEYDRSHLQQNSERLSNLIAATGTRAALGVSQYLDE